MRHALISIGGVLRKPVGGAIIPEGVHLYRALASMGQVVLICYGEAGDEINAWLELHGLNSHSFVSAAGRHTANELRREGYDIGMVVVADPEEAVELISSGHTTLLFTHARYAQPSWRPDTPKGVRPWDDVTQQVATQAHLKAMDERLKSDG